MAYTGFKALQSKLAAKGATNPGALAAYIGRKKYGKDNFQQAAAQGKSMEDVPPIKRFQRQKNFV